MEYFWPVSEIPQCEECKSTNILIFGGTGYQMEMYDATGYEFFREFMVGEFEFGEFSPNLVVINDHFNPMSNDMTSG